MTTTIKQLRIALTVSEEEQLRIRRAYAAFLAETNRTVSMNQWIKEMILERIA